jgi:crotonobetainyl-CoA:carnitine CoA-transferase CaiB-like acyl-CoA transferase
LAVGNDRQFNALRKVLGMPADSRFVTNPDRVRNREALEQLLSSTIASLQSTDLLEKLEAEQIPAGLIQTVGEALQHPHSIAALHRSLFGTGVRQAVFALDQKRTQPEPPSTAW